MNINSNTLLGLFVIVLIGLGVYYLNQNDGSPIPNDGTVNFDDNKYQNMVGHNETSVGAAGGQNIVNYANNTRANKTSNNYPRNTRQVNPERIDNRYGMEPSDSLVDDMIAEYTVEDRPMEGGSGSFTPEDPMASEYGTFNNYGTKRQINMRKMDLPYASDEVDPRDFSYKKNHFTQRTPEDVNELYNATAMLPNETRQDWFDTEPLLTTKKIKGSHLLNPKVHMGVNTVGSSHKNDTHDIRGDIPNPKFNVSPWNNSTIEPHTNIRGICNPV